MSRAWKADAVQPMAIEEKVFSDQASAPPPTPYMACPSLHSLAVGINRKPHSPSKSSSTMVSPCHGRFILAIEWLFG